MTVLKTAKEVISIEIAGLEHMARQLGDDFLQSVKTILATNGRTIICGMGKSGIIGKKIAASFASTGTPSFFMHPGEAFHGDLGMVKPEDVFIAISNSGETDEVLKLLPFLIDNGNFVIAMTGKATSTLATKAQCHLNIGVPKEACPLQLAPTSSTTAALVMGDALTVALMEERDFKPENFARFHPGGSLGRRLLCKVRDEMIVDNLPIVLPNDLLPDVINSISSGKLGLALVYDGNIVAGIITDGDLRRAIEKYGKNIFDLTAKDIACFSPVVTNPNISISEAYDLMKEHKVNSLIIQEEKNPVGIFKK